MRATLGASLLGTLTMGQALAQSSDSYLQPNGSFDASRNSPQFSNAINDPIWNRIDGYTVLNASLIWRSEDKTWQGALNVTNVTNKLYYLTLFDTHTSAGYLNGQPAMPREWSVTVKRTFQDQRPGAKTCPLSRWGISESPTTRTELCG